MFVSSTGCSLENYTSNNTTKHDTTRVQHDTTRMQHDSTLVQHKTTQVQHRINFILIYLHPGCTLGTWYIKTKALLIF